MKFLLIEHGDKHSRSCGRADHAGQIGSHGMHDQPVVRIGLESLRLGHAGGHGHGRDACRADQGIHFLLQEAVHDFDGQYAAEGADHEVEQAQAEDHQRLPGEKNVGLHGGAHRYAQKDGDDVHQGILGRIGQSLDHPAFAHEIAEHEHAHQRRHRRYQKHDQSAGDEGKEDLLPGGHRAQLAHLDLTLLGRGHHAHDGRLDEWHHGHVGIGRQGVGTEQLRGQLGGQVDGRGPVGATDDGHGCRLLEGESQKKGSQVGDEDPQLGAGADNEGFGIGDHGAEVGHGPQAEEDHRRNDFPFDAVFVKGPDQLGVAVFGKPHQRHQGKIDQEDAESDGYQKQGFILLHHGQVEKQKGNGDHDDLFEGEVRNPRLGNQDALDQLQYLVPGHAYSPSTGACCRVSWADWCPVCWPAS
ncbi:hypothetical protein DESC_190105 [Desulfosarcina cetonica]|nr:hypothetical protein DESC_190105 [Desulfosarcina cetonica]